MDDIKAIRDALAAGPTPGPWRLSHANAITVDSEDGTTLVDLMWADGAHERNAAYIAACHPERIARLLNALELAQKDAERYRWLRKTDGETFIALAQTDPDGLDRNIDAAMSSAPQSPEGLK